MDRLPPRRAATRTLAQHHDAEDFRALILAALAAAPVDEQALRDGVRRYVRVERAVGISPDLMVAALAQMVDDAAVAPHGARVARSHELTQWCLEVLHGPLGGPADEPAAPRPDELVVPPTERAHADWRARLTRNLSRRSDGRWEPLTFTPDPPADA